MTLALGPPPTTGLNLVKGKGTNHKPSGISKHAINYGRIQLFRFWSTSSGLQKQNKSPIHGHKTIKKEDAYAILWAPCILHSYSTLADSILS